MKTLVVYYSRGGNTKKVAEAISNAFKCDIEEIIDTKNRSGIWGWIIAGRDATLGNLTKIKDIMKQVESYDLIIIGGPIWSWNVCPAVRTFLVQYMDQIKKAAFFCTEDGSGGDRAFRNMEKVSGKSPVAKMIIKARDVTSGKYPEKVSGFIDQIRTSS